MSICPHARHTASPCGLWHPGHIIIGQRIGGVENSHTCTCTGAYTYTQTRTHTNLGFETRTHTHTYIGRPDVVLLSIVTIAFICKAPARPLSFLSATAGIYIYIVNLCSGLTWRACMWSTIYCFNTVREPSRSVHTILSVASVWLA
jgi:hypothetical protein